MLIGTPNSAPSCTWSLKKFAMSSQSSTSSSTSGPSVQRMRLMASDTFRLRRRQFGCGAGDEPHDFRLVDLIATQGGNVLAVAQDNDVIGDVNDFLELGTDEEYGR